MTTDGGAVRRATSLPRAGSTASTESAEPAGRSISVAALALAGSVHASLREHEDL